MLELKEKILQLQKASACLEPNKDHRKELLEKTSTYLIDFIERINSDAAFNNDQSNTNQLEIKNAPISIDKIIQIFDEEVAEKGIRASSGKHLGYIPGGGIFASTLGDMIAATTNEYTGINYASPGGAAMEEIVINWIKQIFNYPDNAVGNLTSGGSIANLTALTAARDKHKVKGNRIEKSVVYLSEQVHHCINKALRIIGLEDVIIRYVKLDEKHKLRIDDLVQKIEIDLEAGLNPFLIVASAGTTDTGAIDPIKEIGVIARKHNIWFHVDAAYGGFFILTESKKHLFDGIELTDSLVVDPHKSFFLPYGIGAVIIKEKESAWNSFHYTANYMRDAFNEEIIFNASDISPELTKHFRAMRMWLPIQLYGIQPFVACLEEKLLLIIYMRKRLIKEGFEFGPEPDLTVTYFWWPAERDENAFNKKYLNHIHQNGNVYFSSTTINNRFVIRIAILSFRTKLQQVEEAIQMLLEIRDDLL